MNLMQMIKEHDDKFKQLLASHENLLCAFGQLVDDIIDKDMGLCIDHTLVEKAVQALRKEKWMDSQRQGQWDNVMAGLCDTSVENLKKTRDDSCLTQFINRKKEIRKERTKKKKDFGPGIDW